jgi:hypothetical protein
MKIKSIVTAFFLLFISNKGISQHLTYFDLLNLHNSSVERCEEILNKKGFVLSENKYDEESKETKLTWKYQNFSNEYFIKTCSNLFMGECKEIIYMISNEQFFNTLKNNMKANFNIFTYSDTNSNGVLSHHYLIADEREVILDTFPTSLSKTKIFAIAIKKIKIEMVEK